MRTFSMVLAGFVLAACTGESPSSTSSSSSSSGGAASASSGPVNTSSSGTAQSNGSSAQASGSSGAMSGCPTNLTVATAIPFVPGQAQTVRVCGGLGAMPETHWFKAEGTFAQGDTLTISTMGLAGANAFDVDVGILEETGTGPSAVCESTEQPGNEESCSGMTTVATNTIYVLALPYARDGMAVDQTFTFTVTRTP